MYSMLQRRGEAQKVFEVVLTRAFEVLAILKYRHTAKRFHRLKVEGGIKSFILS